MRKLGWILLMTALACAAGCGGGSSSFATLSSSSSSSSSGASTTVTSITLYSSAPQIPSNNGTAATITAIVLNASNAVVPGTTVVFQTSSGVISPTQTTSGVSPGVTDNNGQAAATLSTPANPANRTITVTATVGKVTATVNVAVVGTQISLTGPSSLIEGQIGTFSAALTDSGGNGIANTTVSVTSAKGNTLSAANLTTNATGHVTFTLTGSVAGNDTVTVTALGVSASASLNVSSQNFSITVPSANAAIPLNTAQTVTVVWTNAGAPVTGQTVTFSSTRGLFTGNVTTTTATTDGTGTASVSLSSATAGPAVITASAPQVSAQLTVNFLATNPTQITVQASPATVQPLGSSTISAIVRDPQDNLVAGQTVDFQLTDLTGGSISVANAVTNEQGVAQTVYTATSTASAANGVLITATVQGTSVQGSVNLTVGGQTLFLSLGTGNTISADPTNTQFIMPFAVQALDAAGNAVAGVNVTLDVHSLPPTGAPATTPPNYQTTPQYAAFRKGNWTNVDCANGAVWCQIIGAYCLNEDVLGNGIYQASEDLNGNGRLDPGDVASVSPGQVTTNSSGSGFVNVTYPQDHAAWVQVKLTATATVSGTQSTTSSVFWLPMLATDIATATVVPPGVTSPYGYLSDSCASPF